ncbi:hypothetical protein L6452_19334 [Arctium lappa]|uniref:Uncharacterized protein n=1 Tax=Arctium lappa TaxID=4217 RepID=A0ACB9B7L2_ARCLA|nr:hypothetical protein L6452_19334 [Arctium lappa]
MRGSEEGKSESSTPSEWTECDENSEDEWMVEESIFDSAVGNQGGIGREREVNGDRRTMEKETEEKEGKSKNEKNSPEKLSDIVEVHLESPGKHLEAEQSQNCDMHMAAQLSKEVGRVHEAQPPILMKELSSVDLSTCQGNQKKDEKVKRKG